MKKKQFLMGILALALVFGFTMAACDNGSTDEGNKTPVAGDFNISGTETYTYDGSPKAVTVTAKSGKTSGAVTVKYNGSVTEPTAVGAYTVTFDVEEAKGWDSASWLNAGTLTISNQTPVAGDFNISGTGDNAYDGNPKSLIVTAKPGKTSGKITVKYNGSAVEPTAVGTYAVTFDVKEASGWNAASWLNAGTLTIAWYDVGDTGPGGGTIFYMDEDGFIMTDTGETCHYLEVAPPALSTYYGRQWGTATNVPGTQTEIGTGRRNTLLILASEETTAANVFPAQACNTFSYYGKSDWFLPSRDELNQLYESRDSVDELDTSTYYNYWSSSQAFSVSAWYHNFQTGSATSMDKSYTNSVIPIRAF